MKRNTTRVRTRSRRSAAESRVKLIQSAREEFRRFGFSGATTAAIARKADTSEAHLFRHFSSKSELFREAVFEQLNEHFAAFTARYAADLQSAQHIRRQARLYIQELQDFLREHSSLLLSLVAAQAFAADALGGEARFEGLRAYFKSGAAQMRRRVRGKARVDPDLLVRVSFAAVLGCVLFRDLVRPGTTSSDAQISDAITDFVIEGINVNSDPGLLSD